MNENVKLFVMFVLIVLAAIVGPFIVVWSLNSLFKLNIDYTFQSWCAVVALHAFLNVSISYKKGSK